MRMESASESSTGALPAGKAAGEKVLAGVEAFAVAETADPEALTDAETLAGVDALPGAGATLAAAAPACIETKSVNARCIFGFARRDRPASFR